MSKVKTINVSVTVGYDLRSVLLTELEWKMVQEGKELVKEVEDSYEGEDFICTFMFNSYYDEGGSLVVTHEPVEDDGGFSGATGFIGSIEDAYIHVETDN